MARNCDYQKWVHSNSIQREQQQEEEDQDEEEALSLCDLPTSSCEGNSRKDQTAAAQAAKPQDHQDFDFGSWAHAPDQMCAADDVFFKGRILPLRHSISSESGLTKLRGADNAGAIISRGGIARCASMDQCTSSSRFMTNNANSTSSSRSSSVRSHNSASSGSTSTTTTTSLPPKGYKPKIRNQFHSHPSPSPQLRTPSNRQGNNYTVHPNRKSSSTMWRFFQVGLLRTPEIELTELKIRSKNNRTVDAFGSRNSSTSSSSSVSNAVCESKKGTANISKKRQGGLFGSGCKCSVETVPLNNYVVVKNDLISRSGDQIKEGLLAEKKKKKIKDIHQRINQGGKQTMSRHRTFEWLKQLSLQEGAA